MNTSNKYSDSLQELQEIVRKIEQGDIGIDDLSDQVRRASVLIHECRQKLQSTEVDIRNILEKLDGNEDVNNLK